MEEKEFDTKEENDEIIVSEEALKPTNDFVFKKIFGRVGNEDITTSLIKSITNDEIVSINLDGNTIMDRDILTDKAGILDVKATLNGNIEVDIEMQVASQDDIGDRLLFYWAKLHTRTISKGDEYENIKRTIAILIANFELENLKDIPKYHTKWKILETDFSKKVLTDKFEIDIIELPKVKKLAKCNLNINKNKELLAWTKFFTNPEKLGEDDMKDNKAIEKAKEELDEIAQDEHESWLAEMRIKYRRDKYSELKYARKKGLEEGIEQEKIEIAKKLLKKKVDINVIISATGLTKEKLEKLKNE